MRTVSTTHTAAISRIFQGLQPRERVAVGLVIGTVVAYLLWALALAPAWRHLQAAPARHQAADAQLAEVTALAQEAQSLSAQRGAQTVSRTDAVRAIELATQQTLGATARLNVSGDRVTVQLTAATPDTLARWLSQARLNARLMPTETRLQRSGEGAALRLSGTVVLAGPALGGAP